MAENNQEKKKSSKDLWLVLIFVDIIALCVFSYFIYASFAGNGNKKVQIKHDAKTEDVFLEEIDLTEILPSQEKETSKETKKEIKEAPVVIKQEVKETVQEVKSQAKQEIETVKEEVKEIITPVKENKESYKIVNAGKWRKVTFRYFDEAKKVAIVSGFTMAKPSPLKKVNGVWETTLTIAPGTYRYMFIVDGKEIKDPYNKQEEKGRSLIIIK